jgi:tripartite-type tricarboxylate transporter receptor subunit TctC
VHAGVPKQCRWLALGMILGIAVSPVAAQAEDFFAGKTVSIICGFPPGGGVDAGARLMARHLPRFVPGSPNVIVQNMQGAGGLGAANHLYARAERTGLVLGLPGRDWVLHPTLQLQGAQFDALKFNYIGSTGPGNNYGWIRADLGIKSIAALKASKDKVIFGALTPNTITSSAPKLLAMEGFPIQVVTGYQGTAQIIGAVEKGEVHGILTNLASFARRPDLMGTVVVRVFQTLPEIKDLPVMEDVVSARNKPLMRIIAAPSATGMPFVAPPEVPHDRVAVLRKAFLAMAQDPAFVDEANKIGEPADAPIEGGKLHALYAGIIASATPSTVRAYKELTGQ